MKTIMRHKGRASCGTGLLAALLWAGGALAGLAAEIPFLAAGGQGGEPLQVPRWQPYDFVFASAAQPTNPFVLAFSATLKGPNNVACKIPGFYAGQGKWRVRVSPSVLGAWTLVTQSEAPDLDGRTVHFTCTANPSPNTHGALRVDPAHPQHFVYEDGTPFFLLGYECDWLWALDLGKPGLTTAEAFLDKLAAHGFNYVILNAYAHDTSWRKGRSGGDDFGPPPMFAWEGTNEQPDHRRFNLAYWQHYDRIINALYQRRMIAHIMIKVYNKAVHWPAKGSPEDDLFFRWMIARYAAFPNVHWDFSKEANNEKDLDYKRDRVRFLRENDPYRRLITIHDDHRTYDSGAYNELLDYRSDQQHSRWHATLLEHRQQRAWPVVNVEFGYEPGPLGLGDKTYGVVQAPEEVCRRAWEVYMAGGYGVYYYTYTAWDVIRPQDTPVGYAYFKRLLDFFGTTGYWTMAPHDELASQGYCLAEPGVEYIVFLNQAAPFSLELKGLSGSLRAEWFQPLTGQRLEAGRLTNGTVQLQPPAEAGPGPIVLQVGRRVMRSTKLSR